MANSAILFVTATPNPNDQPAMQEYLHAVLPLLMASGGNLLARGAVENVLEGSPDYKLAMTMAFESAESAQAVFDSSAYQALLPLRDRGFTKIDISVAKAL